MAWFNQVILLSDAQLSWHLKACSGPWSVLVHAARQVKSYDELPACGALKPFHACSCYACPKTPWGFSPVWILLAPHLSLILFQTRDAWCVLIVANCNRQPYQTPLLVRTCSHTLRSWRAFPCLQHRLPLTQADRSYTSLPCSFCWTCLAPKTPS